MSPDVIILIGQIVVKYGPGVAKAFIALFKKDNVTVEDVQVFLNTVEAMDFDTLFNGQVPKVIVTDPPK